MKKLIVTAAILVGLGMGGYAQQSKGLFDRGMETESQRAGGNDNSRPMLPNQHGLTTDANADGPIGSGIAVLLGLGAAYALGKKRKNA